MGRKKDWLFLFTPSNEASGLKQTVMGTSSCGPCFACVCICPAPGQGVGLGLPRRLGRRRGGHRCMQCRAPMLLLLQVLAASFPSVHSSLVIKKRIALAHGMNGNDVHLAVGACY